MSRRSAIRTGRTGARRLPLQGRRADLEEDPISGRPCRRGGPRLDPHNPNVLFAAHLGCLPHALEPYERRSAYRAIQIDRRRRSLDGDHAQSRIAPGNRRQDWRLGVGRGSNRVYAIVENENGGVFSSDNAGATWTQSERRPQLRQRAFYYSRIYADPKAKDTLYVLNVGFRQIHRRRQDLPLPAAAARRQSRPVDRPRQSAAHDRKQRRRRHCVRERRVDVDQSQNIRPPSFTTSPSPRTFRITCAARSRIAPPFACRARRRWTWRARRYGALQRRRRRKRLYRARSQETRISFMPAARARC